MSDGALRGAAGASVRAQAKVNLRLRILARETTGFHQLETLFLRLALADTVRVRRTSGVRSLDAAGEIDARLLGPPERNLAWRAAASFFDAAGWTGGFAIELEKRIPVGGGLGGGSADAGAVLRALEAIAPVPLGGAALARLATTLGADVSFLASEHPYALAWGRGERLLALAPPEERQLLLVVPRVAVNTARAYGWLAEARESSGGALAADGALDVASLGDWSRLTALAVNDFEPVVTARHPELRQCIDGLAAMGLRPAMMSGSGSTVFGVCPPGSAVGYRQQWTNAAHGTGATCIVTESAIRVEPVLPLD